MSDCIFCSIVSGDAPAFRVWEDEKHVAFLSIYPNTDGVTVVIPKQHYESYIFDVPEQVMTDLNIAARKVARAIDAAFPEVGRTGLIYEGFGVNHLHAKLFPMHGTTDSSQPWRKLEIERPNIYFDHYPGYLSTHDAGRADDAKLAELAEQIRAAF